MPVLDQVTLSNLSLDGPTGLSARAFGYIPSPSPIEAGVATPLHRDYSAYSDPSSVTAVNFNGQSVLQTATISTLDEIDVNRPKNGAAGAAGSVVSQIYQSIPSQTYPSKGPMGGHY
jgi:hypothetical protein